MLQKVNERSYEDMEYLFPKQAFSIFKLENSTPSPAYLTSSDIISFFFYTFSSNLSSSSYTDKSEVYTIDYIIQTEAFINIFKSVNKNNSELDFFLLVLRDYQTRYQENIEKARWQQESNSFSFVSSFLHVYWEEVNEFLEYIWDYFTYARFTFNKDKATGQRSIPSNLQQRNFLINLWTFDYGPCIRDNSYGYLFYDQAEVTHKITKEKLSTIQDNIRQEKKKNYKYIFSSSLDHPLLNTIDSFIHALRLTINKTQDSFHSKEVYSTIPYFFIEQKEFTKTNSRDIFKLAPVLGTNKKRVRLYDYTKDLKIQGLGFFKEKTLKLLLHREAKKKIKRTHIYELLDFPDFTDTLEGYKEWVDIVKLALWDTTLINLGEEKDYIYNNNLCVDLIYTLSKNA